MDYKDTDYKKIHFGSDHSTHPGTSYYFLDEATLVLVKRILAREEVPVPRVPVRSVPEGFVCEYCREGRCHKCFMKKCSCRDQYHASKKAG